MALVESNLLILSRSVKNKNEAAATFSMLKNIAILGLIISYYLVSSGISFAQDKIELNGRIVDSLDMPIRDVTITLYGKYPSIVGFSKTNERGVFNVTLDSLKVHSIRFSHISYHDINYQVRDLSVLLELPFVLEMKTKYEELEIVEVGEKTPQIRGDTIEFDVKDYTYGKYDDADVIVSQIPGITIDHEGNITFNGQLLQTVKVDGGDFFFSQADKLLKILPADALSKIQIINDQSQESKFSNFNDGQHTPVINIVLKDDKRIGYFGEAMVEAGTERVRSAGILSSIFKGTHRGVLDMGLNNISTNWRGGGASSLSPILQAGVNPLYQRLEVSYSSAKNNNKITGGLNYTQTSNRRLLELETFEVMPLPTSDTISYHRSNLSNIKVKTHSIRSSIEYKSADNRHHVNIIPTLSYFQTNLEDKLVNLTTISQNTDNLSTVNLNNNKNLASNLRLNYSLNIDTSSTFSISFDNGLNHSDIRDEFINNSDSVATSAYPSLITLRRSSQSSNSLTMNYTYMFTNNLRGLFYSNNSIGNEKSRQELGSALDSIDTNEYSQNLFTQTSTFGSNFSYVAGRFTSVAGLSYQLRKQKASLSGEEDDSQAVYSNFLPSLLITYQAGSTGQFRLEYRPNFVIPSLYQQQNYYNVQSIQNVYLGNQNLIQERIDGFNASFSQFIPKSQATLMSNLSVNISDNKILEQTHFVKSDTTIEGSIFLPKGTTITTPLNTSGFRNIVLNTNYSQSLLDNVMNINAGLTGTFDRSRFFLDGLRTMVSRGFNHNLDLKIHNPYITTSLTYLFSLQDVNNTLYDKNIIIKTNQIRNRTVIRGFTMFAIESDLTFSSSSSRGFGTQSLWLWNIRLHTTFLKGERGGLSLKFHDLFNNSVRPRYETNNLSNSYRTESLIGKFFLVSFSYRFRKFGL